VIRLVIHALRDPPNGPSARPVPDADPGTIERETARILCRACGAPLAELAAMFAPHDAPLVFANPAGMVFELRAVRSAPGVRAFGERTTEATWFPGYAWRLALCARCMSHVGWQYLSVAAGVSPAEFYGLITREIVEGSP
jgi:hypothetical protein